VGHDGHACLDHHAYESAPNGVGGRLEWLPCGICDASAGNGLLQQLGDHALAHALPLQAAGRGVVM
jgi:hypothetical protein